MWGISLHAEYNYNQGVPGDPFTTPIEYVGMLNHVGTHVDAYYHMRPDGKTIDDSAIDRASHLAPIS